MVNLEKISDLLEKGVENPSFQNKDRNFSGEKWKKEVQEYTESFLQEKILDNVGEEDARADSN